MFHEHDNLLLFITAVQVDVDENELIYKTDSTPA